MMKRALHTILAAVACVSLATSISSCDSVIYDDEGDCEVRYHVPFTFTKNMLNSDAFASQVTAVTLYVFDRDGNLVLTKSDSGDALSRPGYKMDIDLAPGHYSMIAWCSGTSPVQPNTAFNIGSGSSVTSFGATLPLLGSAPSLYSDLDIRPLYYGCVTDVVCAEADYGDIDLPTIDLMKDTNLINLVLLNRDNRVMTPDDFSIRITGSNSAMTYLNDVAAAEPFDYRPWSVRQVQAQAGNASESAAAYGGLIAEITVGRIFTDIKQRIIITRTSDGDDIISIDLVSLLLAVKSNYHTVYSDQDYLDRMDHHKLIFILSNDLSWYTADGININGWTIVPPQDTDI